MSWTARNLGVPPRLALVPGILFAVTPYTVSNLYGRGDWAELVAVGALAVAVGAATSVISGHSESELGGVAALAVSVAAIAGTHNLTLLLSALVAPVLAVALLPLVRAPAREVVRRYALVLSGALTGLALCGAFLIPDLWLSGRTVIAHNAAPLLTTARPWVGLDVIFDPLPGQPAWPIATDAHTQTLVVALVWCLGTAFVAAARGWLTRRIAGALLIIGSSAIGTTLLIVNPSWWLGLPRALTAIQFTYRLVTYLALLTVFAIAVLLAVPAVRRSRAAIVCLLAATAWQIGVAGYLALSARALGTKPAPTPSSVLATVLPAAYNPWQQTSYRLVSRDSIKSPGSLAGFTPVGDDTPPVFHLGGLQPAGSLVATQVVASPLIQVSGDASIVGVTPDGFEVLRVERSPWTATVTESAPAPVLVGRIVSLIGAIVLAVLIAQSARRRRRRGRPGSS
jgi:hypothetical protein